MKCTYLYAGDCKRMSLELYNPLALSSPMKFSWEFPKPSLRVCTAAIKIDVIAVSNINLTFGC